MYGLQSVVVKQATLEGISITECLLTRSVFQVAVMPLISLCSAMNFFVPKHHHRNVFFICTWYTFASTSVFGAFSLILPDAAVAGRSASRTIISVIFTVVTLHEAVTLLQLCALCIAVIGMVLMGVSTTQLNDFYVANSWRIVGGFFLCFLGGLFRSIGFTRYRQIKEEVSAEAIVFWHALQSCSLNIPVTLIFQNYSIPSSTAGKWLVALCFTATGGTLGSNKALQDRLVHLGLKR
ncbi:Oidioi.mRNA.OKI2018_I69.chr1.g2147.t1.cds [Oikopleura dioica]|uniref:Oidioi.mRNA.OKI2018_I69.chr1.g2147.t1.cds n=1 Tax=Oikopleura dioica TaxID=34765 RepID=A0ABN7SQ86_OIKDI|nr:Oidioi.mRNA.OKI2018_I69.chr1.g2147.t1.cds [Oikopleura dioica]